MFEKPFAGMPTDYFLKENWLALPDEPDKPADLLFLYDRRGSNQ